MQVHGRLALWRSNQEHKSIGLQVLAPSFGVRPNIQVPATAWHVEERSRCQAHAACCGHRLGLAEDLRDVDVVQTLPQLQQVAGYSFSYLYFETSDLQKLFR